MEEMIVVDEYKTDGKESVDPQIGNHDLVVCSNGIINHNTRVVDKVHIG